MHATIRKGLPKAVMPAWSKLKSQLVDDPRFVRPDKRAVWGKAFPDIPNHRHADLPGAWRACWTIRTESGESHEVVTVVFLGTHKRYDRVYGFSTS